MTEVDGALIVEHLRRIRERLSSLEAGQTAVFEELRAHKSLIAGALGAHAGQDARTASIEARLDRIERRLELREEQ